MNNDSHSILELSADCRWLEVLFAHPDTHPKMSDDNTYALFPTLACDVTQRYRPRLMEFVSKPNHKMMSLFAMGSQMTLVDSWREHGYGDHYDHALDAASAITLDIMTEPLLSQRGLFTTLNIACQIAQLAFENKDDLETIPLSVRAIDYFPHTHEYKNLSNYGIQLP